ncbi:hypothetical protein SAMN06265379_101568 [Saccharicrinis carchari]|uniref:Carbohydrate binding domain-containing protein n=1 Tax=Saccharicrinis carchari TaxID=1168039 RepID=A0A521B111_SACCC|nr:hypothetical protein [Saccharicrinis carchari]SMO40701.1 hypothetical protein SAMN06265379_101568 [Saccharicrinis carchari]
MKKLFTLSLMMLFIASIAHAQTVPLDFESSSVVYTFTNFDGGDASVINNPYPTGINPSAKVGQMIKNTGQHWAGSLIVLENAIDFSLGKTFKMKVYSPKVGAKVLLKVENNSDPNLFFEKEVATTLANEWEELVFDYGAINSGQSYQKIVIIFELGTVGDGSADFTYLFDDIILEEGAIVADDAPTTPAPTPPSYDASKVISIFSDAFTDIDGTNFNPYWDFYQTTVGSIEAVEGNEMVKLRTLNFHGFELAQDVNAAGMKYMHIDVWTANETSLDIYPICQTTGEKK